MEAAGTAAPRVATARVWIATFAMVSSGMTTTAPAAAAAERNAPALRSPGLIPKAVTARGRAPGAISTTLGSTGRSSGPDASTRIKISGFDAARSMSGSSFAREIPASCAFERRPLLATSVRSPDSSIFTRRSLTFMLFPLLSTSGTIDDAATFVTKGRATGVGANALVEVARRAEEEEYSQLCQKN